ncbi:MAG: four-carbon acid sugar kinase family protein [Streptosporangiaceae bacterium]
MPPQSVPAASQVLAGLPAAAPDSAALRQSIRAERAEAGLLLGVLDDDPTGSQAVHDVQIVTVLAEDAYAAALGRPAGTCFVLTNTRSLGEAAAVELNTAAALGLFAVARRRGARIQLISRSDSTLRGHVLAEVGALQAARRRALGSEYDGVLLIPAFIEAGRLTAGDIQWARSGGELVAVGDTEYARDPVFGYTASDLRDFLAERSGGAIHRDDVGSISLADIRIGGADRIRELLSDVRGARWVVVNATEYSDLEIVAYGVLLAERAGKSFLYRTGPSFVRALTGIGPKAPLRGTELWPGPRRGGHGLIVVGSHVNRTARQLDVLRARRTATQIELDVPAILAGASDVPAATARKVAAALRRSDVVLYTSRAFVPGKAGDSLAVARAVSAALARTVREALVGEPAWILAKGGITAHDVAVHGLGIRRAEVAGQLFPGMISLFRPIDAPSCTIGVPYVVFAGNVGDDAALAQVVAILNGEQEAGLNSDQMER